MKLPKVISISLSDKLIQPDQEQYDIPDELPKAQDYQHKFKVARLNLETELPVIQNNWVKYLDC